MLSNGILQTTCLAAIWERNRISSHQYKKLLGIGDLTKVGHLLYCPKRISTEIGIDDPSPYKNSLFDVTLASDIPSFSLSFSSGSLVFRPSTTWIIEGWLSIGLWGTPLVLFSHRIGRDFSSDTRTMSRIFNTSRGGQYRVS
ncbi:hypothetical protein VTN00DRAFT_2229 [Thermoascus crustaceus]|uniref:uncharacterized protein n=1 Tax=Thermoascus crustaceus TaxID=5088 RepID=UPI003742847F